MSADMAGDCCRELESQIIQFAAGLHALKLQAGDKVSTDLSEGTSPQPFKYSSARWGLSRKLEHQVLCSWFTLSPTAALCLASAWGAGAE